MKKEASLREYAVPPNMTALSIIAQLNSNEHHNILRKEAQLGDTV
jgi:hypothetical protein